MGRLLHAASSCVIVVPIMKISVRFTAAVHTLLCILYFEKDYRVTSDFIAASTGVNAVIIRKILLQLQKAELIQTAAGVGGSHLIKAPDEINLFSIYIMRSTKERMSGNSSTFIRPPILSARSEKASTAYLIPHCIMYKKRWKLS